MTPEELREIRLRKRRLARMRFKSLVCKVIFNIHWITELEDSTLGDNVKRNVEILMRKKGVKGILNLKEKAILITPYEHRTIEEKRQAANIVSVLPCFQLFSPKLRSRMSRIVHFQCFEQGRTIVREGHYGSAVYFILDGNVTVSKRVWREFTETWTEEAIAVLGPGETFGEVSLLNDVERTATCTTSSITELLCVYKNDFDLVLKSTLKSKWDQIDAALKRYEYFRTWSPIQVRQCCMLGTIKQFEPLQTIYGEDRGRLSHVFFVLSGKCIILQALKMKCTTAKNGNRKYDLNDIDVKESASRELIQRFHKAAELKRSTSSRIVTIEEEDSTKPIDESVIEITPPRPQSSKKLSIPKLDLKEMPEDVIEFVEVGSFSCGSVFGLGEQMEHRSIVAKNYVQCLLIPRYWLFQKSQNMGNVWQRTKMYLDSSIPSRQKIYKDFLCNNNWKKYKKDIIEEFVQQHPVFNATTILDVPIICRVEEGL